jgi:hypothetical protein
LLVSYAFYNSVVILGLQQCFSALFLKPMYRKMFLNYFKYLKLLNTIVSTIATHLFKQFNHNWDIWKKLPIDNKLAIMQKYCLKLQTKIQTFQLCSYTHTHTHTHTHARTHTRTRTRTCTRTHAHARTHARGLLLNVNSYDNWCLHF